MPLGFAQGRPRRANAVASLASTGHVSPAGRRPFGGAAQHAHLPGPAARPGPAPLSARHLAAISAQNARMWQAVAQTITECQREVLASNSHLQRRAQSLAFTQYDFDRRAGGRDAAHVEIQLPGTYQTVDATRYQAGALWIYTTELHTGWGDHQYFVYNSQTGNLLHFTPEASITDPRKRVYASKRAQFQNIAAGTGVVGGYLEKGFGALALGGFGAGVALEAGGYYLFTEQVTPTVTRIAVQAWRVAQPAVRTYAQRAAKGALVRMAIDASFQFGTSYAVADPSKGGRGEQARRSINGSSVVAAGLISVGEAKTLAKFLIAFGSSAATNLVTLSGENKDKYNGYWHTTDFTDHSQRVDYVRNVILGTLFDQSKEYGSEWVAKRLAGRAEQWAAQVSGRASKAVLQWITESRVALPASLIIGGVPEILKKRWENKQAAEEAEKTHQKKTATRQIRKPAGSNSKAE